MAPRPSTSNRTVTAAITTAARALARAKVGLGHGTSTVLDEAAFLVGEAIGCAPDRLHTRIASVVTANQQRTIDRWVASRIKSRKPASYITGTAYLQNEKFVVDERVIVPRSFIAELIHSDHIVGGAAFIPKPQKIKRVLDLCTGSGCLAILAAKAFPNAVVDAVELSGQALAVARINVAQHRLKRRVRLWNGDLFAPLPAQKYDLIISNPPYVSPASMRKLPAEYRREPAMALAGGGADGLDIVTRIIDAAPAWLAAGGALICEVGGGRSALEKRYPSLPFLWLDTAESTGEVFWITAPDLQDS
ncbi:MAG: 50S ribosomal protein L3 N(5)-glutamine methyltransferase [Alphaproteobacteria bacterium]|nr:50S ribosomal protein L3 N(5)-glutamine methyltransferase [Alphaproteobacteria bacterium]